MDYNDPQRSNNVDLAENVKFVEPNITVIYSCPVIMAQQEKISLVFVAPNVLNVQAGDILCSPQAGGIMHKIVAEVTDGEFRDRFQVRMVNIILILTTFLFYTLIRVTFFHLTSVTLTCLSVHVSDEPYGPILVLLTRR